MKAADKAARVRKAPGVKAGTGWTAARRAAFEANKLLKGMPMQTQQQAAAVMQADAAPLLKQPGKQRQARAGGGVPVNPALSGSEQVSRLAQAGAAAAVQAMERAWKVEGKALQDLHRSLGGSAA